MSNLPRHYSNFIDTWPGIAEAYDSLGEQLRKAGSLDESTVALIKLAIAVGNRAEGAVHSHARRSKELGIPDEHIRQTVLLSITTIGFPNAMAALSWVNDDLGK